MFTIDSGFQSAFPTRTLEVNDIGLSAGWLHNQSDHRVRITSMRFVNPPKELHMLNVLAYSYKDTHGLGIISQGGVLSKECPKWFKPRSVRAATFPPNSDPPWLVILAFTLKRPGIYRLDRVRIDYQTNGHTGWQRRHPALVSRIVKPRPPRTRSNSSNIRYALTRLWPRL